MVNSLFNWLLVGCIALLHPFYVSKVEINHNAKDKNVEISIRIFTDDLELTLRKFGNIPINLSAPKDIAATDKLINKYIQDKLRITIDDKISSIQYLGFEINKESVWIYYEIPQINTIKKVGINCSLLYDYKQEQMNIIQLTANGKDVSYKLDNPKSYVSFSF
ncbi:MAG TPA: hypothetical protein PKG56_05350 [Chitinophagaceae bacterium]|nr:hypothetical protein [Chitinophagaceae bacterium]HNJ59094.1 hypothetical protein [Chitinophagaceae bacterium]HNL82799.1 hypothetical protein [Chitinophagaceae bacterium]